MSVAVTLRCVSTYVYARSQATRLQLGDLHYCDFVSCKYAHSHWVRRRAVSQSFGRQQQRQAGRRRQGLGVAVLPAVRHPPRQRGRTRGAGRQGVAGRPALLLLAPGQQARSTRDDALQRVDPDGQVLLNRFHLVLPLHATAATRTEGLHSHQELHPGWQW